MKFALTNEQQRYFETHGALELEALLSAAQLSALQAGIDEVLASRLNVPEERLERMTSDERMAVGRDAWRASQQIKKVVARSSLAEVLAELTRERVIRLGYDQLLLPFSTNSNKAPAAARFYTQKRSLKEISALTEVTGGLLLCIRGNVEPDLFAEKSLFPQALGSGTYLSGDIEIDFQELNCRPTQQFLLIVYTTGKAAYTLQPEDPHTHALKNLGYVFGDRLNDVLHPIVFR